MEDAEGTLGHVRQGAQRKALFLPHAIRQMSRADRMITTEDVLEAIEGGELVEDYPRDPRGHSCLLLGRSRGGRAVHVVCAPKDEYLAIITAYVPGADQWEPDLKTRKKP